MSANVVRGLWAQGLGSRFESCPGGNIASQRLYLWVSPIVLTSLGTWAYSLDMKWPGHETDLLPLSRADVKNVWHSVPTPPQNHIGTVRNSEEK